MPRSRGAARVLPFLMSMTLVASLMAVSAPPARAAGTVSLTALGSAYTQDFNTLASTGTANTAVPTGWEFSESGTNANTTYRAGTGSDTTGDTYSFGAASNTERAFGGLRSGSLVPLIGAQFTNNTGGTITSLAIAYTGEQWRLGQNTTGRAADRLDFQLSSNATSITTGTWTDYDSLDFASPVVTGTLGALDGNAAANRTATSFTITGLSIANGASFWIRWADTDLIPGADDGLSVDDFSLTPDGRSTVAEVAPTVSTTSAGQRCLQRPAEPEHHGHLLGAGERHRRLVHAHLLDQRRAHCGRQRRSDDVHDRPDVRLRGRRELHSDDRGGECHRSGHERPARQHGPGLHRRLHRRSTSAPSRTRRSPPSRAAARPRRPPAR